MSTGANRSIWLRLGLWPAMVVALAPIMVALLHLLPPANAAERHGLLQRAATERLLTQRAAQESGPPTITIAEFEALIASGADHCPPRPDAPAHHAQRHCPLCYWLQGFHVMPPPEGPLPQPPGEGTHIFVSRAINETVVTFRLAAQPRAPPTALQA